MTSTTAAPTKKSRKVLIVEDHGEMGLVLDMILSGKDYEQDYVKNLAAAETYLQENKPSIVILDNKLPDGYGVDFIGHIKQNYPEVKIMMVSGYNSVRDTALANGADAFFEKPFQLDDFYETVDRLSN